MVEKSKKNKEVIAKSDFRENHARTNLEISLQDQLSRAFFQSSIPPFARLQAFPAFVRRQDISRFLVRHELFHRQLSVSGSVVELGVYAGSSLFSWSHFSTIYEPFNHTRRVFGFDTFEGFPGSKSEDLTGQGAYKEVSVEGGLYVSEHVREELEKIGAIHDENRPIGHIPKVHLIEGDISATVPRFVEEWPHLPISLLYFDADLYEPTKIGLEFLLPRVPVGGIVAFDDFAHDGFPGETLALFQTEGFGRLERSPIDPHITWFTRSDDRKRSS